MLEEEKVRRVPARVALGRSIVVRSVDVHQQHAIAVSSRRRSSPVTSSTRMPPSASVTRSAPRSSCRFTCGATRAAVAGAQRMPAIASRGTTASASPSSRRAAAPARSSRTACRPPGRPPRPWSRPAAPNRCHPAARLAHQIWNVREHRPDRRRASGPIMNTSECQRRESCRAADRQSSAGRSQSRLGPAVEPTRSSADEYRGRDLVCPHVDLPPPAAGLTASASPWRVTLSEAPLSIMVDAGIGRLLDREPSSGHRGCRADPSAVLRELADPARARWRAPVRAGAAQRGAELPAARRAAAYDRVMRRAGRYSADWTLSELSPLRRAVVRRCPTALRARWALDLSRRLVAETFRGSRARVRLRRGAGSLDIRRVDLLRRARAVGGPDVRVLRRRGRAVPRSSATSPRPCRAAVPGVGGPAARWPSRFAARASRSAAAALDDAETEAA